VLSAEDNALLTRTAAGTPMGAFFRRFWLPVLLAQELPEPDGPPVRVKVLGEDLVAFRDTEGRVGLLDAHCPHRGASLFFGRNEECGLRCVYHGWKYDAQGNCVDMPSEPAESTFKDRIHLTAYPCVERSGVLWTYMGAQNPPPPLPDLEWSLVPEEQRCLTLRVQSCNWMQALEGEIDSSHAGFLHSRIDGHQTGRKIPIYSLEDKHPRIEVLDTRFGVTIGARRDSGPDEYYWRINQFVLPFYTLVPPSGRYQHISGHAWVPIDDEHTLAFMFTYHPTEPLGEKQMTLYQQGYKGRETGHLSEGGRLPEDPTLPYGRYWPRYNRANDYCLDRDAQREHYFSGIPGVWVQDAGCQESMGPIADRTGEHLGTTDAGIIRARRRLLADARALRARGEAPPSALDPDVCRVRSVGIMLPRDAAWVDATQPYVTARGAWGYAIP